MDPRICVICGDSFIPRNPRQKKCDKPHYKKCIICGKDFLVESPHEWETKKCCSKECKNKNQSNLLTKRSRPKPKSGSYKPKVCKYCGKEFIPKYPRQIYCGDDWYDCPVCGKPVKIVDYGTIGTSCSRECAQVLIERTNLARYGCKDSVNSDHARKLAKIHCLERYGCEHYQSTLEFKDRFKQTCLERYGVTSPLKSEDIKEKQRKTNQDRYNGNSPMCDESVKAKAKATADFNFGGFGLASPILSERIKSTNLKKYGVEYVPQSDEIKEKIKRTCELKYGSRSYKGTLDDLRKCMTDPSKVLEYLKFKSDPKEYIESHFDTTPSVFDICRLVGVSDTPVYDVLINSGNRDLATFRTSSLELALIDFLKTSIPQISIIQNTRSIISPYEIDIYLPEYRFGIECNPTITHNSTFNDPWNADPKSYKYHQMKSDAAENSEVDLFHVFGYDWTNRPEVIKSMILSRLGALTDRVYGRNTYIDIISYKEASNFLNINHRQGSTNAKIRLGLRSKATGELLSLMTFNLSRSTIGETKSSNCEWELSRFCSKINMNVVGGASKLFSHFIDKYNPKSIVSFSDRAHTSGKLYPKLGFIEVNRSSPSYVWVKLSDDSYLHRVSCQKRFLKKRFPDCDIDSQTEREIMSEHGYAQVFDSGTIRWEWKR